MDCNSQGDKLAYLMVTMQNAEDLVRSWGRNRRVEGRERFM